jgi:hypothetical protein
MLLLQLRLKKVDTLGLGGRKGVEGPRGGGGKDMVLGTLEVFIPCVLFKDKVLNSEADLICSDRTIKAVITYT